MFVRWESRIVAGGDLLSFSEPRSFPLLALSRCDLLLSLENELDYEWLVQYIVQDYSRQDQI